MKLELALRYQPLPQRAATAWYFPVAEAAEWVRLVARAGWDQSKLRCLPIPRSRGDLTARGVLFLPMSAGGKAAQRDTAADFLLTAIDPRLQPFGELHARVYLPVQATLNAAFAPEEFADLAPTADALLVWLPDLGLLSLAQSEVLSLADLLRAPAISPTAWDAAEPGPALNTRLLSLQPMDPPTLDDFRQAAQDGIGSQAAQTGDLPPSPREASPGLAAGAGRALTQGVAGAIGAAGGLFDKVKGLFSSTPRPASNSAAANAAAAAAQAAGPSMFQRLRDWATQQQQRITDSISAARDRELTRLLEMLQKNPDEGLRYAIPLAGDAARGIASPGSQLTRRDTNFRFGGGSGPSDYWAIAEQNRQALIARYRDLASREIALGRHRRAAYIFAELLGDFGAAAQTLADGQHYREAALLYEERLRNPRAAAKCLEQGGLLTEAIAIYQRLGEHETVGDLYTRLEQKDLAAEAYEQAYLVLIEAGNFLRAAEFCEQKFHDVERALTTLDRGWLLSTNQRQSCFLRSFTVLARETQHERARKYLEQTIRLTIESRDAVTFVPDLVTVATTYPDAPLRDFGKDQSRLLIGRHLSQETGRGAWEQQSLLQALNRLEPGDRLLARDTRRFEAKREPAWPVDKTRRPAPPKRGQITQVEQTQLPCDHCQAMVSHGNHYYIAGMRGDIRVFLRADEQGRVHYPTGKPQRVLGGKEKSEIRLNWNSAGREKILVLPYRGDIADRTFPATDRFPEEVTIGSGPMVDERTLAVSYNGSRALTTLALQDENFVLHHHADPTGKLLKSHYLDLVIPTDVDYSAIHLHAHFEHWFIACLDILWIGQGTHSPSDVLLGGIVRGFVAAPANSLFRLVALLDEGIHFTWGYLTNLQHTRVGGLANPVACFTDKGQLIVAGNNGIEVYTTNQDGLRMIAELKSISIKPIGVLSIPGTQKFIVVQEDGLAITYSWT
jgi:tetratricopeptide (TPR) repeat protein